MGILGPEGPETAVNGRSGLNRWVKTRALKSDARVSKPGFKNASVSGASLSKGRQRVGAFKHTRVERMG